MSAFRKDRVSASALSTFVRCPEQYRQGYLLDQWSRRGPAAHVGTVVHTTIEEALKYKAAVGVLPSPRELVEMVDLAHSRALAEEDTAWDDTMTPGSARARAGAAVAEYANQVLPSLILDGQPEAWFELAVAGSPVPVVGKLDLPVQVNRAQLARTDEDLQDSDDWEAVIVDLKTGGQAAKQIQPQWRIQAMIYACVARKPIEYHTVTPYGQSGPVVRTPHTPTITQKKPTKAEPDPPRVVEYECGGLRLELDADRYAGTLALVRQLVAGIQAFYDRFGADEPWPSGAVAHTWACNLCDHRPACVYWHGASSLDAWGV